MFFPSIGDKLLAGGLGLALVVSVGFNVSSALKLRDRNTTISTLDKQINDPKTGYVARLATCRSNNQLLQGGISDQNASLALGAAKSATALAKASQQVAKAQIETGKAQAKAADILSTAPQGANDCERFEDIDRRVMESLK